MMRRLCVIALLCLGALAPLAARAESTGEIDWQRRVIKAHGQGAPDLNAPSISVARLNAEGAAKADALRNLLETLKGVTLQSGDKAGTLFQNDNLLRGKVEGSLRGFKVIAPHYYSDGGVGLEVEISLDKLPADLLARLPSGPLASANTTAAPALAAPINESEKTPPQAVQPQPIDRSRGVVQARGQGVPRVDAPSIEVGRIGAERAARLDAVRVLLAALKSGSAQAGALIESDSALGAKVDGALRGYKVSAVHYYSDGGVALDVEVAIDQLPPELRAKLQSP